jgi:hypothetical protein
MKYAGLEYEIIHSRGDSNRQLEFTRSNLPTELVCRLASLTYEHPSIKQAVLDALTPFQILSKQWAVTAMAHFLDTNEDDRSPIVYVGSWFGQTHALASRVLSNYAHRQITLIDLDPEACAVSRKLIETDSWQRGFVENVNVVCGDALTFDLSAYADECGADPIVVWTGIEHFDGDAVKQYIRDHEGCDPLYLLQGTNMPATDHVNLIASCEDLEQYFEGDPIYSARLKTAIGDRFQTVFATLP